DELIDEEQAEQAKLNRAREKRREKKSRQREKRADLPAAEQPERELPEKAPAPEKREKSELSGEALQKRVAELRREKTRATQKARHLARRIDEEAAKAEASKAQLLKLQTRSQELRALRSEKKEAVERAEESEAAARRRAEALSKRRSEIQLEAAQEAEKILDEAETLKAELEDLKQKRMDGSRPSFAAVRHKRILAEQRRKELQLELMGIAHKLRGPEGGKPVPPLFTAT
ncbi:XB3, partial [Symbiodinium sp. KB8]